MKWYEKLLALITIGISYGIKAFKTYKMLAKACDLNKNGKTSLAEIKKVSTDVFNGNAVIEIKYKK